jgi:iron-sulfur cluster assembly protein
MKDGILEFRVDKKSAVILEGSTLDYIDTGLIGRGFSFRNPQEKSRCGCGVSFQT